MTPTRPANSAAKDKRYSELERMQAAGSIQLLDENQKFALTTGEKWLGEFVADFTYDDRGELVAEMVRPERSDEYLANVQLMKEIFGVTVREIV